MSFRSSLSLRDAQVIYERYQQARENYARAKLDATNFEDIFESTKKKVFDEFDEQVEEFLPDAWNSFKEAEKIVVADRLRSFFPD